jgi:hypothetical protein
VTRAVSLQTDILHGHTPAVIADMTDGSVNRDLVISSGVRRFLSFQLFPDGAAPWTAGASLWTIMASVVEREPNERYKSSNIHVLALYFSLGHPSVNWMMEELLPDLLAAQREGISLHFLTPVPRCLQPPLGTVILDPMGAPQSRLYLHVHSCTGDIPALHNLLAHKPSGFDACPFCLGTLLH